MTYFLKTSSVCKNNCVYCSLLNKKTDKDKSLKEIEKEIKKAKKLGYESIRLSCNTDIRKDFLDILKLIKKTNLKAILETNARMFSYADFLETTDKFIDKYEIYFGFPNQKVCNDIIGIKNAYEQTVKGIENISEFSENKEVVAKIVLIKDINILFDIIDRLKEIGVKKIKFIYPFKLNEADPVLSLVEAAPLVSSAKEFAFERGIEVLVNEDLEYNPYLPESSFFDTGKAELKINYQKYKSKPDFSIVIPACNKKSSLKLVLKSYFKQDYLKSKYEVIVIDDGSRDNALAMAKKLKPTCNFKYFYWPRTKVKKNKWSKFYNRAGLSRNIGVKNAEGDIILFNDADILPEKDCLKKHEKYHKKYPNIIIRGFRMFLSEKFESLPKSQPEKTERGIRLHCRRVHNLKEEGWQRIVTANLSLRKRYLEKIGGFGKDFCFWGFEDTELGYRLSKMNLKFIWDDKIKVYHLWHKAWPDMEKLTLFWLGENLFYRKHFDEDVLNIHARDAILRHFDKLISNF